MMIHGNTVMSAKNINEYVSSEVIEYLERSDKEKILLKQEIEMLEREEFMDPERCYVCRKLGYDISIYDIYRGRRPYLARETDPKLWCCDCEDCVNMCCYDCIPAHMYKCKLDLLCDEHIHSSCSDSEE